MQFFDSIFFISNNSSTVSFLSKIKYIFQVNSTFLHYPSHLRLLISLVERLFIDCNFDSIFPSLYSVEEHLIKNTQNNKKWSETVFFKREND